MYGYLTLEQCYSLKEQGFAVICDGDKEDCFIRDSEKEYIANCIPQIIDWVNDFVNNLKKIVADTFRGVGRFFNKIGEDINKNDV